MKTGASILFLFIISLGFAQDDKERFEESIFRKEIDAYSPILQHNNRDLFSSVAALPDWFFETSGDQIFIGISDPLYPAKDSGMALQQALQRAIWQFSLQHHSMISMMSDYYRKFDETGIVQTDKGNFYEFGMIYSGYDSLKWTPRILYSHFTEFGEMIVQIRLLEQKRSRKPGNWSYFQSTFFSSYQENGNYKEKLHRIELSIAGQLYQSKAYGHKQSVLSNKDSVQTEIPPNLYTYKSESDSFLTVTHGIWNEWMQLIINRSISYAYVLANQQVKTVEDHYGKSYRGLTRQLIRESLLLSPASVVFSEGRCTLEEVD